MIKDLIQTCGGCEIQSYVHTATTLIYLRNHTDPWLSISFLDGYFMISAFRLFCCRCKYIHTGMICAIGEKNYF